MADTILINTAEVARTAETVKTINQQLALKLEEIKKEMNALESSWQSDASNTIRNNFNSLAPRFEEYRTVVDSYAKFLNDTVNAYDQTESAIDNNASAFK